MQEPELIEIKIYNDLRVLQYSFLVECVMDSVEFREVVDEALEKGYDGWSATAVRLSDAGNETWIDDKILGC